MSRLHDVVIGEQIDQLRVVQYAGTDARAAKKWLCVCSCGGRRLMTSSDVMSSRGRFAACAACKPRTIGRSRSTHGETKTRLFRIWAAMKNRCYREKNHNFKHYGGKGVRVCAAWQAYVPFRDWALANGYADSLTIDRVDPSGNYEPANCRWITHFENVSRVHE